jgi:hypothetical protein
MKGEADDDIFWTAAPDGAPFWGGTMVIVTS